MSTILTWRNRLRVFRSNHLRENTACVYFKTSHRTSTTYRSDCKLYRCIFQPSQRISTTPTIQSCIATYSKLPQSSQRIPTIAVSFNHRRAFQPYSRVSHPSSPACLPSIAVACVRCLRSVAVAMMKTMLMATIMVFSQHSPEI